MSRLLAEDRCQGVAVLFVPQSILHTAFGDRDGTGRVETARSVCEGNH